MVGHNKRLHASALVIEDKIASYNSEWAKLYTEIQSLKSSQWQGIASDTFNSQLEAYKNDFEEMAKILLSYVKFLKIAAQNYAKIEESLRDTASGLNTGRQPFFSPMPLDFSKFRMLK